jgi:hypothetical protein
MSQVNTQITVVAGTPVNLSTLVSFATRAPTTADVVYAWQLSIQMKSGSTGLGYVMDGVIIGRASGPLATNVFDLSLQISPPSAGYAAPAYNKTQPQGQDRAGIKIHELWVDGSQSGDIILVSFDKM